MVSIEFCKRILEKNEKKYSEEQVKFLRQLLYQLGEIDYTCFKNRIEHAAKSDNIYSCINR
jgi:hypothetical protein